MDLVELFKGTHPTDFAGVLALVVLYYARKDAMQHKREIQEVAERYEGHEEIMIKIVQENTAALAENIATSRTILEATKELRVEVTELRKSTGRA